MRGQGRPLWGAGALTIALVSAGCSRSAQSHVDSGDAYLAKGNPAAAILEFRNAVDKDPTSAPAYLRLAELYIQQENSEGALANYVRAADLLPNDVDVQLKAGALLLAAGRAEDAKARAEKALAIAPRHIEALVLRANAMAGLTDLDGALEQMQQAVGLDPSAVVRSNLGAIQAARGNLTEAEAAFRQAVATDPRSVNARLALSQFLWTAGRRAEAESALKAALALDPADLRANRTLAYLYLQTNRAPDAEIHLAKAAEVAKTPTTTLALADYYAGLGRPADAMRALERLSADPRSWAIARAKIADLQYRTGETAEAFKSVEEVLARAPGLPAAHLARARMLLAGGKVDEAMRDIKAAQNAAPRSPEVHFVLGAAEEARNNLGGAATAYTEVLRLNPRATAAQIRLAMVEMQRGDVAASTKLAEQVTSTQPGNLTAQLVLARALLLRGELDRAAAVTKRLAEMSPDDSTVQNQVGMMALARGDRAAARVAFEKAIALQDPTIQPLQALVTMDLQEQKPEQARARVEQRLARTPDDSGVLAVAGRTWAATGDLAAAERYLRRAIEKNASNLEAYLELASVYMARKDPGRAVEEFDKLAARQPDAIGPQTMAALLVQAQGNVAEAQKRYERLVELDPRAAVASNNLAWILASRGEQLDRALQLAQAAKAEIPDHPEVNDTLAFVYLKKQLPALALPLLRLAVEHQPHNPAFHYHLGLAYEGVGDKAAARRALEQAFRQASEFEGAADARAALRRLS